MGAVICGWPRFCNGKCYLNDVIMDGGHLSGRKTLDLNWRFVCGFQKGPCPLHFPLTT